MAATTKTLGPLHFEDLELKRFEDLTRQLVYDFKFWRRLEATGRAGSDDGFDVWDAFPQQNKAWLEVIGVIPFENILDVDELGDECVGAPHVYAQFVGENGPFKRYIANVTTIGSYDRRELSIVNPRDKRIAVFAPEFRDVPKEYSTSPGPAGPDDSNLV